MDANGKILRELVNFVEEQRGINHSLQQMLREHGQMLREHSHEHKAIERRWQKMFLDHEKWMRSHEVRLSSHYKLIQDTRDKLG